MKTQDYTGMTEKQITASFRAEKLGFWLAKQELDASFNRKQEAAIRFEKQLQEWANDSDAHSVAPTFHAYPGAC